LGFGGVIVYWVVAALRRTGPPRFEDYFSFGVLCAGVPTGLFMCFRACLALWNTNDARLADMGLLGMDLALTAIAGFCITMASFKNAWKALRPPRRKKK
jgi:hypothetical protein